MDLNALLSVIDIPSLISGLAAKQPTVAAILVVMGSCRIVMKPLLVLVHTIVDQTHSQKDEEILNKVENSKVFKTVLFVLDYLFSIKMK